MCIPCLVRNLIRSKHTLRIACLTFLHAFLPGTASAQMTLETKPYTAMPITGLLDAKGNNDGLLAGVNAIREEPGGANRFFVPDLNGPLYILDKDTKKFTTYSKADGMIRAVTGANAK